ncbi:MAG: ATP-binding cassette domain-containing protein [Phycicoccus sp.]
MIEVVDLVKRYGPKTAVDEMTFTAHPGRVTGFLGPNGVGKSTTMRVVLGLDAPTSGHARVAGHDYRRDPAPITTMGALLDGKSVDKARSARNHLRAVAATVGIGKARVDEVLEIVGLAAVADQKAGGFSLGMGQRLGIGTALLGDPEVVMLDEPVNGLDPDGILWIRDLLRSLAREGHTVLLSSHLMSEMELTADHLVVVGQGRVLADESMSDFIHRASAGTVHVETPQAEVLSAALAGAGASVTTTSATALTVSGVEASRVGEVAAAHRVVLHRLADDAPSLEEAFMALTRDTVDYRGHATGVAA